MGLDIDDNGRSIKIIKLSFSIMNVILLAFGLSSIVVGTFAVSGFVSESWPQALQDALNQSYVSIFATFVILVGVACLIFGVFGLLSTYRYKNFWGLCFYSILLFWMAIFQMAVGMYAMVDGSIDNFPFVGKDLSRELRHVLMADYCTPVYADENPQQALYGEHFQCTLIEPGSYESDSAAKADCLDKQYQCYRIIAADISDNMLIVGIVIFFFGMLELTGFWTGGLVAQHNRRVTQVVPYSGAYDRYRGGKVRVNTRR